MRSTLIIISLLFSQLSFADICQFVTKLNSTVNTKYKTLVGPFDQRGRYFQPTTSIVPGVAKCSVGSLSLGGSGSTNNTYACRWELTSKAKLDAEFKSMMAKLKTCRFNKKRAMITDSTKIRRPRDNATIKWTNYSRRKIMLDPNTYVTVSKQTVVFLSNNSKSHLLRFSFGAFTK